MADLDLPTDPDLDNDKREPSELRDDDLFQRLKSWFKEGQNASVDWRKDAKEDFAFVAGDQWSDEDKEFMKDAMRPMATFNGIEPIIDNVAGLEVNNRQETTFYPREQGDAGPSEMLTNAADWARDGCDAEDEESDAFREAAICGMGWTDTRMDYDDEPDGRIVIERVDPLDCYWDATSRKKNLADARWVGRVKEIDIADARSGWPGHGDADYHAGWAGDIDTGEPHERVFGRQYEMPNSNKEGKPGDKRRKVRVVEMQWWERAQDGWKVADPASRETIVMSDEEWPLVKERLAALGMEVPPAARVIRRKHYRAILGAKVLENAPLGEEDDPIPGFTLKAITAKRDRNNGSWYGLVRNMREPQKWKNKFLSTILDNMARSGKGVMAEKSAPADGNVIQFERDWSRPDKIKWLANDSLGKGRIQTIDPTPLPAGIGDMLEFADQSLYRVSGINLEMMGLADREQAGVLEQQRKQSAVTILAGLFDALRRYRKEQGRVLLYFIQHYIPPGTLIRVQGEQGVQYVPFQIDPATRDFDVIVDEAPSSPDNRAKTWMLVQPMLPIMAELGMPIQAWLVILENSPFPDSVIEQLKKAIMEAQQAQGQQLDPEMAKIQMQAEMEGQKLQMEQQAKAAEFDMKRREQEANFALKVREQQMNMQMRQAEMQMTQQAEAQKMQMQLQGQEREFGLKAGMAQAEIGLSREKAAGDLAVKREAATQKASVMGMDSKKGTLVDVTGLAEGVTQGFEAVAKLIQSAEAQQAQRDQQIAELVMRLSEPKPKSIAITLPSGKPFAAMIGADGQISGDVNGRVVER